MRVKITIEMDKDGKFVPVSKKVEEMNPKELILYAAAMCASITMKNILDKENIVPKSAEIEMSGTLDTEEVAAKSVYRSFNILYRIECNTISEQSKIGRAINLTTEKYCGTLQMLRRIAPLSHEVSIVSIESSLG
jgi:putative redox protein